MGAKAGPCRDPACRSTVSHLYLAAVGTFAGTFVESTGTYEAYRQTAVRLPADDPQVKLMIARLCLGTSEPVFKRML